MTRTIEIDENGNVIDPMGYAEKLEGIEKQLTDSIFYKITPESTMEVSTDTNGNAKVKKATFKKNEILPLLTTAQVNSKLNELLRVYRPLSLDDAKMMKDTDFLEALKYYMKLISWINNYLVYTPSKQTFCAFANITTAIYNELLADTNFQQVFSSIEDYLIDSNFTNAQAGIVDNKTTVIKLQTKEAGHNLVKNPEALTFNNFNLIDTQKVDQRLERFNNMMRTIETKKK